MGRGTEKRELRGGSGTKCRGAGKYCVGRKKSIVIRMWEKENEKGKNKDGSLQEKRESGVL